MRHDIRVDGFAFRLRPITLEDAGFILKLRSTPSLGRFLQDGATSLDAQRWWQEAYFEREGDYYFIVERLCDGRSAGTIAIYDVRGTPSTAEWGRWVIRPGSLAAPESAYLIYKTAFEVLQIDTLYCCTNVENTNSVSFQERSGMIYYGQHEVVLTLGGQTRTVLCVKYGCDRAQWPERGKTLSAISKRLARVVDGHAPAAS
jgi:RimJ/RimL family protein N-acetyltransferase